HVALRVYTANDEEMPVRLSEEESRQLPVDRRNERDAGCQKQLRLAERAKTRDEPFESEARRVGHVRRPASGAFVVPVVRLARRVIDVRVVVVRPREFLEL